MIREMYFLVKYASWRLPLESLSTNQESLNRTQRYSIKHSGFTQHPIEWWTECVRVSQTILQTHRRKDVV